MAEPDWGGVIDLLWVIHDKEFFYVCLCTGVLQLKSLVWLKDDAPLRKIGVHLTASDYVDVGTWMTCPKCAHTYRVDSIQYDDITTKSSGVIRAELSLASGAQNATGARLRMLMLEDED